MLNKIGALVLGGTLVHGCVVRNSDLGEDGSDGAGADHGAEVGDVDGGVGDSGRPDDGGDGIPPDETGPVPDPPPTGETGETGDEPPPDDTGDPDPIPTSCDDFPLEEPVTGSLRAHMRAVPGGNQLEIGSHPFDCGEFPRPECRDSWVVNVRLPAHVDGIGVYDLEGYDVTVFEEFSGGPPTCEPSGGTGGGGPGSGELTIKVWNDDCVAGYLEVYDFPDQANGAFRAIRCE